MTMGRWVVNLPIRYADALLFNQLPSFLRSQSSVVEVVAKHWCGKLASLPTERGEAHNALGRLLLSLNRISEAVELFATAVELGPSEPRYALDHALALRMTGEILLALDSLKAAHEPSIDDATAFAMTCCGPRRR